ncbi:LapA family protein [Mycolicibacterium arenosum]|uniref:Lipopolysaccharide assembly protein LapA domain-containing protein n=1 Tax=Mycolicibacterium arenosum TaxID=2952157 RepID=A0ABT1MAK4_9MYCO|nr:lipopolysaccharide assembly protein LapA domain-containing protein [Mycolicibacterium sp. CAU 1645]MCP9275872.1 lipopolysaccharide assembly protein LapA domain-containing protein [Mycolicibacterium sp. CAU 1645]
MSSDPLVPKDPGFEPLPSDSLPAEAPIDDPVPDTKPTMPADEAGKFTRAGALWSALAGGFVVLILLLVFVMQNTDTTTIHMFGWAWELPVGVALLLAAIAGGLLTFLVGTVRILQLRRAAKKNLKAGF